MKITAKLALSQVKENRRRTLGAIVAISISTALMTAISCFVSSGNGMLKDFLGENYGTYGGAYKAMLMIPVLIFGLLIFFMSVTVISNVFRISANQRMKEFGVLKCVGGTTKQIRGTVVYESIWLSIIGIPLGLILGVAVGYIGVFIAGQYIEDMNQLQQSIIMRPVSISLKFVVTPFTFVFASVFSFITVIYSAYRPAKKAGKITALACIKGLGEIKVQEKKVREGKLVKKIFGFEGLLANRNLRRSSQSYLPTIRALSIGIMLILSTSSLAMQAKGIESFMDPGTEDVMVDYCSSHEKVTDDASGMELDVYNKPIDNVLAEKVAEKLREYDENLEITGVGVDNGTSYAILDESKLSDEMKKAIEPDENNQYTIKIELVCVDQYHYEKLCKTAGVPVGSNILLNYYKYNDNGRKKELEPFEDLSSVELRKANRKASEMKIQGVLTKEEMLPGMIGINNDPLRILVPNIEARYYDWICDPEDEADYMEYARTVSDEFFPTTSDDSYAEEGFSVRICRMDIMTKILNIAIVIAEVILYCFVALLLLIGIVSVITTLSTNVLTRAREFAVLKTVGMTSGGLRRMLFSESVICTLKATLRGVPLGILIPWLINLSLRKMFPVLYSVPWGIVLLSVVAIFGLITLITFCSVRKLKKQNLIETIRMEMV